MKRAKEYFVLKPDEQMMDEKNDQDEQNLLNNLNQKLKND